MGKSVDSVASFIIPSCVTLGESVDLGFWDNDRVDLAGGEIGLEFMLKMESVLGGGGARLKFQYLWGQRQEDL